MPQLRSGIHEIPGRLRHFLLLYNKTAQWAAFSICSSVKIVEIRLINSENGIIIMNGIFLF